MNDTVSAVELIIAQPFSQIPAARLPALIAKAAADLAQATTAAEILDVMDQAQVIYDAAKSAHRTHAMKTAHESVVAACRKAAADALIIETQAQCCLAREYDAAQKRGEVAGHGASTGGRGNQHSGKIPNENLTSVPNGNTKPTVTDIGLTQKIIHEARVIASAETAQPGVIKQAVEAKVAAGEVPKRSDVKRAARNASNYPHPKNAANPGGAGRPPGSPSKPKSDHLQKAKEPPQRHPKADEIVASAALGLTSQKIAAEVGIPDRAVRHVLEKEQIRQHAQPAIDPATLSQTAQQKLEAAIRQHKHKLDLEYATKLRDGIRKWIADSHLPHLLERQTIYERIIKARRGVMPRSTYRKVLSCLHPDRVQDPGLKKMYEEAFNLFKDLEKVLLSEAESPTDLGTLPRTMEEWDAARAKVSAERRAKRQQHKTGVAV